MKTVPYVLARVLARVLAAGLSPVIAYWAKRQERRILREGVTLSGDALDFAKSLGIERPEEVRLLVVQPIPLPVPNWLMRSAARCGLPVFAPGGMALGQGIYLLPGEEDSLPHELVHVLQYQRLGGIRPFMRRYLVECLVDGYGEAALEREARGAPRNRRSPNA